MNLNTVVCLGLVGVLGCGGGGGDDNNTNNANNANNTNNLNNTNNANNMSDMGMDAEDMRGDTGDTPDMSTAAFKCEVLTWAPFTVAASEAGNTVEFKFTCTGVVGEAEVMQTVRVFLPDGMQLNEVVATTLRADGDTPGMGTIVVPVQQMAFQKGSVRFEFADSPGDQVSWTWTHAKDPEVRLRQTLAEISNEWSDAVPYDPAPPVVDAERMKSWARDVDADGTLDLIVAWRAGTDVHIETHLGDGTGSFVPGPQAVYNVGATALETNGEDVFLGRRKGATNDQLLTVYWYGLNSTSQILTAFYAPIDDGAPGGASVFASNGVTTKVDAVLGSDFVDDATSDRGSPELIVLYRGTANGAATFGALVSVSGTRSFSTTLMPKLGATLPASSTTIGLLRDQKSPVLPQAASSPLAVMAYVYTRAIGPLGAKLERVVIAGGEAGAVLGSVNVSGVAPTESSFKAEAVDIDGDKIHDLTLTSIGADGAPIIRAWPTTAEGRFGAQKDYTDTNQALRAASSWTMPSNPNLASHDPRLYTSVQRPHMVVFAQAAGSTDTHFFGAVMSKGVNPYFTPGTGEGVTPMYEGVYGGDTNTTVYTSPILVSSLTRNSGYAPGDAHYGSIVGITVVKVDDKAVVASHPANNTVIYQKLGAKNALIVNNDTTEADNVEFSLARYDAGVQVAVDSSMNTYILAASATDKNAMVWSVTYHANRSKTVEAPMNIRLGDDLGRFDLMSSDEDTLWFSSHDNNEFRMFSVTTADVQAAVAAKQDIMIDATDITNHGGNPTVQRPPLGRLQRARRVRHASEERSKRTRRSIVNVGSAAAEGARETYTVLANDEADACPFDLVLFTDLASSPVVLEGSGQAGCWDLPIPIAMDDFCGVGGTQIVTMAAIDTANRTAWTWEFVLWIRMENEVVSTSLGTLELAPNDIPTVSSTDINGDGLVDLGVFVPRSRINIQGQGRVMWMLSDGFGGALSDPTAIDTLSDVVRTFPGSGNGLPAGEYGCGQGLQCAFGKGTKESTSAASAKPQLL